MAKKTPIKGVMIPATRLCIVRLRERERMPQELTEVLDEVDISSIHEYVLPANASVELHYHQFDEYWLFTEGSPTVTLRLPDGTTDVYKLGPGDLVITPRGTEHTLAADHTVKYFQFSSKIRPGASKGHLTTDSGYTIQRGVNAGHPKSCQTSTT